MTMFNSLPVVLLLALVALAPACGEVRLDATSDQERVIIEATGGNTPELGSGGSAGGATEPEVEVEVEPPLPFAEPPFSRSDDFEGPLTWDVWSHEEATAERVATKSRSGDYSILFSQGTETSDAMLAFPLASEAKVGDRIHVRAWFFVPEGSIDGRVNLISSNGLTAPDVNLLDRGVVEVFLHPDDVRMPTDEQVYPTDRWFCFQTGLYIHPTEGSLTVNVGGEEVLRVSDENTTTTSFEHVLVGLTWLEMGQTAGEIYLDDIAIDSLPIPCD